MNAARRAGAENIAKERREIDVGARNTEIGVVKRIEKFRAEFEVATFADSKSAVQGQVKDDVAWSYDYVAAGVAEREGCGDAEGVGVEPVGGGALASG